MRRVVQESKRRFLALPPRSILSTHCHVTGIRDTAVTCLLEASSPLGGAVRPRSVPVRVFQEQ
jgi:hypothetical protein